MKCPNLKETGFFTIKRTCFASNGIVRDLARSNNAEVFDTMTEMCKTSRYRKCPMYTGEIHQPKINHPGVYGPERCGMPSLSKCESCRYMWSCGKYHSYVDRISGD